MKNRNLISGVLALMLVVAMGSTAFASVTPASVSATLAPGESIVVDKEVTTPEIAPKLDFLLLVDLSGSYYNDLTNIRAVDDGLFDDIRSAVPDSRFAVGTFIDYPTPPWGGAGDYPFNLDQDFTTDKSTWTGAIDSFTIGWGNDFPESQYAGLKGSAEDASWREDAVKVIAITTDASFHVPTDMSGSSFYPGPSRDDTIDALNEAGITVIAIKAPGSGVQMDDVAAATGGSVVTTSATSFEIADAILEGLGNLPVTVIPTPERCDPLVVSYSPAQQTVIGGDVAGFTETITVPLGTPGGTSVSCTVVFYDEYGNNLGEQEINVDVPDTVPPVASCEPTTNPSGKNVPPAGEKSPGENEDGFYQLLALDNVDGEDLDIYVSGFGPFASGDKLKITEAPGAEPKELPMGGGKADNIAAHLILPADAEVTVTDSSGNEATATCLVAPLPK